MVNIYLGIQDQQVLMLSIPPHDIERLSIYPIKWLRFVAFAICGAHGDLSEIPNGLPADYNNINLVEAYYYKTSGEAYYLIDQNALNDTITSSEKTACFHRFHNAVMERDGPACVFTGSNAIRCDAAHIIPHNKGDEYISIIFQDRLNLYNSTLEAEIPSINSVENGIFLRKDLHASFGIGDDALLKTPNFALGPGDIPRIETGPMPLSRITLQHLKPDSSNFPLPQCDAHITGTGISPPPSLLLDFMYGVAAFQRWGTGQDINKVMEDYFTEHYESIPIPPPKTTSDGSSGSSQESDDPNKQHRGRTHRPQDEMLHAMDGVLALSMLVKGTTPQLMAAERQRQEEERELHAKEASRVKVQQWKQTSLDNEFQSNATGKTLEYYADNDD